MDNPKPIVVFDDNLTQSIKVTEKTESEHQWKLYNARFEYAWKYFDFHATQRTTMFNFFIIFSGILIKACSDLIAKGHDVELLIISMFGILVTIMFIFLERRNEELVYVAEDILHALEEDVLFKDFKRKVKWPKQRTFWGKMIETDNVIPLGIFIREAYSTEKGKTSKYLHGQWLPIIQFTVVFLYVIFIIASLIPLNKCFLLVPLFFIVGCISFLRTKGII